MARWKRREGGREVERRKKGTTEGREGEGAKKRGLHCNVSSACDSKPTQSALWSPRAKTGRKRNVSDT